MKKTFYNYPENGFNKLGVSVIIPSYKPASYIYECLDSLKKQTLESNLYEVIIVLNGCDEPYYSKIISFIKTNLKNINVCLIQTNDGGVSNSRNIGLDNANGEYICFVDDDDVISESYLKELYILAKKRKCVVIANSYSFYDKIEEKLVSNHSRLFNKVKNKNIVSILKMRAYMSVVWGKIIHKSIIANRRFNVNFTNNEDSLFMFTISDNIQCFSITNPDVVYYRRLRNNSLTHKINLLYLINNNIRIIFSLTNVYIKNINKYSFVFYITRILATLKNTIFFVLRILNK